MLATKDKIIDNLSEVTMQRLPDLEEEDLYLIHDIFDNLMRFGFQQAQKESDWIDVKPGGKSKVQYPDHDVVLVYRGMFNLLEIDKDNRNPSARLNMLNAITKENLQTWKEVFDLASRPYKPTEKQKI